MVECANRTIVEMARSMLHAQKLDKSFWMELVVNVVYTRNRCPTKTLDSNMPQKIEQKEAVHCTYACV
jgi:hypothetical protein